MALDAGNAILTPAAILVAWSLVMLGWTAMTRFPAIAKSGVDVTKAPPGGRGVDFETILPANVNWKSHNYTHLMEQPTIFYASIFMLYLTGAVTSLLVVFAWGYTLLRIAHSIWQATVNTIIPVRFGLFLASTFCLIVLSVNAVIATV